MAATCGFIASQFWLYSYKNHMSLKLIDCRHSMSVHGTACVIAVFA